MKLNTYIDHTLLKADAQEEQIINLCHEAKEYEFASVCVNGYWVETCAKELKNSKVKVCTVVGFPLGAMNSFAKAQETQDAIKNGADEIDMVINIGELKAGHYEVVKNDIEKVVESAKGRCVKVILENCLLEKSEIIEACQLCVEAKASFVKTSTGFSTSGADVADVKLMKKAVDGKCKIKAAGGIRSYDDMMAMIDAGADRIGTSAGVILVSKS